MESKRPLGVTVFGVMLCVTSILKLINFFNFSYYRFMFQHLQDDIVTARYCFSIFLRITGLACGIGLFALNEKMRRVTIGLGLFTVLTIYWKHPIEVFQNIFLYHEELMLPGLHSHLSGNRLVFPEFPRINMTVHYLVDLAFSLAIIAYLINPKVKQCFK